MLQQFKIFAQYCYPKHAVSRLVGLLAAAEAGPLTQFLIKSFIKAFKVDMSEALESSPEAYRSFNEFFTRPLKPGIRPIDSAEDVLCLPVDGTVSQAAKIQYGRLIQAKGHDFSARTLLGGNSQLAKEFSDGDFTTIYLAPSDYHRIHMPCDAKLRSMTYVPGDLFSVNPLTAENIPNLFARNERVSVIFDTEFGPMAMVLVGATIVASIETTWAGTVTPPTGKQVVTWDYQDRDISFNKGDEMGRFKLGSTVVLLFPKDTIEFDAAMTPKTTTRLGQIMAKRLA